eukprot:TRINITY_DN2334_c0_g2_i1.p1 TRINITY_DN2334_c0_g2~~TRINITY_DN2334_c0_g2_i1.p1  ORF type:complete len:1272 (+),score=297.87 TRINITY_DN2334_c0_g2_i1:121-3936(+)
MAFHPKDDALFVCDQRGRVFAFLFAQNRYALAAKVGSACVDLAFSSQRPSEFLTISSDGAARCFDMNTHEEAKRLIARIPACPLSFKCASWNPITHAAAIATTEQVVLWDTKIWKRIRSLDANQYGGVCKVSFAKNGSLLLVLFRNGTLGIWGNATDVPKMSALLSSPNMLQRQEIYIMATNPSGSFAITCGRSSSIFVWDLCQKTLAGSLAFTMPIRSVEFVPGHERRFILLTLTGLILGLELDSGNIFLRLQSRKGNFVGFTVHRFSKYLATYTDTGEIFVYDFPTLLSDQVQLSLADLVDKQPTDASPTAPQGGRLETKRNQATRPSATGVSPAKDGDFTRELYPERLKLFLRKHGKYPDKYRNLVWCTLLHTPQNSDSFAALLSKGTHPDFNSLDLRYPIKSRSLFNHTQKILSALAHWSPLFIQIQYLPELVFPFIRTFGTDDLKCFEVVSTYILNWCDGWFDFFPYIPVGILNSVDMLLQHHDSTLHADLLAKGLNAHLYAWPLLHSSFSEVLTREEWLHLYDHIFSSKMSLLYSFLIAYLKYFRTAIMNADAQNITAFLHRCNPLEIRDVLELAYKIEASTPFELIPVRKEFVALTSPRYPLFNKYPAHAVDAQLKEWKRLKEEEDDLLRRRNNIEELRRRAQELQQSEEDYRKEQELLLQDMNLKHQQAWEQEQQRTYERLRTEHLSREQRLRIMTVLEESRKQAWERLAKSRRQEVERFEVEAAKRAQLKDELLRSRMEEETLLTLESEMRRQNAQAELEQENTRFMDDVRRRVDSQQNARDFDDERRFAKWRAEDITRREKMEKLQEHQQKKKQLDELLQSQKELGDREVIEEMKREIKLIEISSKRRQRQYAEDEMNRLVVDLENVKKLDALREKEEAQRRRVLLGQESTWREERDLERMTMLEQEKQKHLQVAELRGRRIEEMERAFRRQQFENELLAQRKKHALLAMQEEKEMQKALMTMKEEEKRGAVAEMNLTRTQREFEDQLELLRRLRQTEDRAVAEEREHFQQIREEMRVLSSDLQRKVAHDHEHSLQAFKSEREKQLMILREAALLRTHRQEIEDMLVEAEEKGAEEKSQESDHGRHRENIVTRIERESELLTLADIDEPLEPSEISEANATRPSDSSFEPSSTASKAKEKAHSFHTQSIRSTHSENGGSLRDWSSSERYVQQASGADRESGTNDVSNSESVHSRSSGNSIAVRALVYDALKDSARDVMRKHEETKARLREILSASSSSNSASHSQTEISADGNTSQQSHSP